MFTFIIVTTIILLNLLFENYRGSMILMCKQSPIIFYYQVFWFYSDFLILFSPLHIFRPGWREVGGGQDHWAPLTGYGCVLLTGGHSAVAAPVPLLLPQLHWVLYRVITKLLNSLVITTCLPVPFDLSSQGSFLWLWLSLCLWVLLPLSQ